MAALGRREACVCHLARVLGRSQPYVSQHLAILRSVGLLTVRRQGTFSYYALRDFSVLGIAELAARLTGNPSPAAGALTDVKGCTCPACRTSAAGDTHAH